MAPRPIFDRVPEQWEQKSVGEDAPHYVPQQDTPSPRTPTTIGSLSPPPIMPVPASALVPLEPDTGIPLDHNLPHYIRHISGEQSLDEVQNMSLRVLTETASLQQMALYTPNLRELNLEGSGLTSLRDIGSELRFLQVLRIGRCQLRSLDGTLGLTNLRELYAAGNMITNAAPCAHLSRLRTLDLSRNHLHDMRSLGFLGSCRKLQNLRLTGNPINDADDLLDFLSRVIATLQTFNDVVIAQEAVRGNEITDDVQVMEDSLSLSSDGAESSSRISSANSGSESRNAEDW